MGIEQTEKAHKKRQLNPFDAGIVVVILLAIAGYGLAKAGHAGVDGMIDGKGPIEIDISFTGVKTLDTDLFKVGAPASLSIRNQPVQPPMHVTNVLHWAKQVSFLSPDGKRAVAMADPANPIANDFLVTVQEDHAERTSDGWIIRGAKIKVGNPVDLESAKYRISGVVADIHVPGEPKNVAALKQLQIDTSAPGKAVNSPGKSATASPQPSSAPAKASK